MSKYEDFASAQNDLLYTLPVTDREAEQATPAELAYSQEFFAALGNPQEEFPSVHVAGTSGKGSVAHFTSALLKAHGAKVGTLISPHVRDIRERAMIDFELTDTAHFVEGANQITEAIEDLARRGYGGPRFAEIFVGLGFLVCQKTDVDYAVVETVMGGRYDPTNTIERADKLAVITSLGLDHESMLGATAEAVAWHKAGIMPQAGQATAFLPDSNGVEAVLRDEASKKDTTLVFTSPESVASNVMIDQEGVVFDYRANDLEIAAIALPTLASYQVKNAALALDSLKLIAERDGFAIDSATIRQELASLRIPARLEVRTIADRQLIIDGATNPQKLAHLVSALRDANIEPPVWVFGAGIKKDHDELFAVVGQYADGIVFSDYDRKEAPHQQGQSADARLLKRLWEATSDIPCLGATRNVNEAFAIASESSSDRHIVMAGSVYMIGEFEAELFERQLDQQAAA